MASAGSADWGPEPGTGVGRASDGEPRAGVDRAADRGSGRGVAHTVFISFFVKTFDLLIDVGMER